MGKKKLIQNYQLLDLISEIQDKYQIYKSKHITQKQFYTLKKVKIKNDKNNRLYQSFLYEASLLKGIKHPNIVKSIKMMKTTSSIYVVYDFWQGETLEQWMQKAYKKTLDEKQTIIKQLSLVLNELNSASISHLYLNPQSIFINEKGDIKVTNFVYGLIVPDNGKPIESENKVPKTDFTAPEVRMGKACLQSDIYSFGKIIEFMDLLTSKKGILSTKQFNVKIQQYKIIIRNTTRKNPIQRATIQQVHKSIFKKKARLKNLQSMSLSLSRLSGKESIISRTSLNSTASGVGRTEFVKNLILALLRKRNMAKLLVELFKGVMEVQFTNPTTVIILSTLFLKKSTIIMNNLAKFMKFGKGIPGMQINERERSRFFKSSDYFKLQPLIDKQVKFQKKQLEMVLQTIFLDNVKILQNKKFNSELKKQQIDQKYFKQVMVTYINESLQKIKEENENENVGLVRFLYLIVIILDHGSIEQFFEQNIQPYPVQYMQQPIFVRIFKQTKVKDMLNSFEKFRSHSLLN